MGAGCFVDRILEGLEIGDENGRQVGISLAFGKVFGIMNHEEVLLV